MNELPNYVDELFRHQHLTSEIKELKEEILSNMVAKRDDLIAQGMSEAAATQKVKESLASIDGLVEANQLTYIDYYYTECLQTALLNCIIFWICSLPLLFTKYALFSNLGFLATSILGILYLTKKKQQTNVVAFMSISASLQHRKKIWIIWSLFFLVYIGMMAALTFGSDIWFGRKINISGPYQMANLATRFYFPLLTVVLPITIGSFTKILIKNEKRHEDE